MKRILTAAVAVAAIAFAGIAPTRATTFPSLTTIYVASGVIDSSLISYTGINTIISCSNMSGQTATVRYVFRYIGGSLAGLKTLTLPNLQAQGVSSVGSVNFAASLEILPTGGMTGGTLQVLSTQSGVFCSAMLVDAASVNVPAGIALHMVRYNPHPGTVE